MRAIRNSACAALFLSAGSIATAEDTYPQPKEPPIAPAESHYCAREGESIEQRIERLETALRLAKAERIVNAKRKGRP